MPRTPGHRALRSGRVSLAGQIYIVTTATYERARLFESFWCAASAARMLVAPSNWVDANLLCWVLMPDHAHLMIELGDRESLSIVVNRVKAVTAKAVNRHIGRRGIVWAHAFHDRAIRDEDYVVDAARYIVANPLRAGLVRNLIDYPFWDAVWL